MLPSVLKRKSWLFDPENIKERNKWIKRHTSNGIKKLSLLKMNLLFFQPNSQFDVCDVDAEKSRKIKQAGI